jgi:hypothetical protein
LKFDGTIFFSSIGEPVIEPDLNSKNENRLQGVITTLMGCQAVVLVMAY